MAISKEHDLKKIAEKFNTTWRIVQCIKLEMTWKHLNEDTDARPIPQGR